MKSGRSRMWNNKTGALLLTGALAFFLLNVSINGQASRTSRITRAKRQTVMQKSQAMPTPAPPPVRVPQLAPITQATPQATPAPAQPKPSPAPTAALPTPPSVQTPVESDDEEVIRVTSNLVAVPTSVTDASGNPVQNLRAEDFRLEEEGHTQKIAEVGSADQVPLDIAILFDVSSSVMGKLTFTLQQESAAGFLKQVLKPADRAAIITIADKPTLLQPLASADAASAKLLTIPAASTSVPTAFYDTVSFAAKYLAANVPGGRRRVILVISDGDDNFSSAVREQSVAEYEAQKKDEAQGGNSFKAVRAAAHRDLLERHRRAVLAEQRDVQRADIVFYSINPGGPSIRLNESATRAQNNMQQLADSTGGTAYVPERSEDLERIFRQITAELRAQYLLQYYPTTNAANGQFLHIKVTTPAHPDLHIRARQGYYAKK